MRRKEVRKLLISTMATALLGTLTIGVAGLSASAETYSENYNYFNATGGTYTITNPTEAAQGVKLGVQPTEANGTVDLSFNGAGCLYNFDKKSYWGGEFHYKMADPTSVDALMVTYRSTSDQDYSISFITTVDGTYVSLTDDIIFKGNVPYANGAATPMTLDLTEDCATLSDMVIGFRPTSTPTNSTAYSTTEMFKGATKFHAFNLLNSETMLAEAEDAGFYADRYTQAWIEQLCWDMSYSASIMEISFVGVDDVNAGAALSIWTMNGFDYQAYVSGGYNASTNAVQRQQFDYNNLFVQKSKDVRVESSNGTAINGMPQLWEVWTPTTETGRAEINVDPAKEFTYLEKSAMMSSYADANFSTLKASVTTANNMLAGGYHIFRPGLVNPVVYYKTANHPWAGRFNVQIKMTVTINGGAEQVIYVPDNKDFRLADIPELSDLGCLSATWVSGSGNFYTPGTEFNGTDTIKVHNEYNFKMAITTAEHTESTVAGVEATCTKVGKAETKVCSVCEKVLSGGELLAAQGHNYSSATYEWSEDNSTCTATATCMSDGTHTLTETVLADTTVTQEKDCSNDELSTFTATFKNSAFATQTKENVKTAEATGHTYGEATYEWTDVTSCKATSVCANNEAHVTMEIATGEAITSTVTQNKSCTQDEITTYTATFANKMFVAQTKEVATDEKDTANCAYGEVAYTWAEDNSTCTASRTCTTNAQHIESETVNAVQAVIQEKDCSNDELSTFTATFANEAFAAQTKENVKTDDATGHSYGEVTYAWSEDNATCTATRVCANNEGHVETETVEAVAVVAQEKDCMNDELSTFTATFANEAFATQTKENVKTDDATGHTYGEVIYTWSEDNATCTATRVCANNEEHIETETVTAVKTITQEATTSQVELSKFEAVFENDAFAKQTKENVQTGDMLPDESIPDGSTSDSSTADDNSSATGSGCFGSISALSGVAAVLMAAGAMVAVKRRKED